MIAAGVGRARRPSAVPHHPSKLRLIASDAEPGTSLP